MPAAALIALMTYEYARARITMRHEHALLSAEADVYFEAASWSASGRFSSEVIPGDRLTLRPGRVLPMMIATSIMMEHPARSGT